MKRRTKAVLLVAIALLCIPALWIGARFSTVERRGWRLFEASLRGDLLAIKFMVWLGTDVNYVTGSGGAMHGAAFTGRTDIMEFLYRHGAQIDAPAKFGVTPLYEAHMYHQPAAERWLIAHGASTDFSHINPP